MQPPDPDVRATVPAGSRRRLRGPSALLVALVVAACGAQPGTPAPSATGSPSASPTAPASSSAPSPSASGGAASPSASAAGDDANAALYAEIEGQVEQLRGLQPKRAVARTVLDEDGLRKHVHELLDEQLGTPEAAAYERLLKALRLVPADANLQELYQETLSTQIAGQYDPEDGLMYIISRSGRIGPNEEITYAHEFTHALQDQYFDLKTFIGEEVDQSDRSTARSSLVEGDATLLMTYWAQRNLTPAELAQVLASVDPEAQAVLDRMPKIISESLMFPYQAGLALVMREQMRGGWNAVNDMFGNPPASTEQVLHPEKYERGEAPVAVAFPADLATRLGAGWKVAAQDTMGEFGLDVWLRDVGRVQAATSTTATAGWGGDRVALVEGPSGAFGLVADTAWDTQADADEFATAAEGLLASLRDGGRAAELLRPDPSHVVIVAAEGADTLGRLANVLGLAG